ncbi:MAG: argininosuccinate synthase [Sedimentisphaerales bacterium]|jgi:argininosuccinate synthase|nr:argininosuccinate synthase [Sedimentisphaerales bacterium]HNY79154.1 argininosuccinate synthase [Sedimentisphaerales bacterium]HOC64196.1 argininosuccinate synthase [Sedimentisphaerales bacterium]HOH65062.1 argininosuccinate synthase [Sedimentisphaerales bacterium]HQA90089.1 argininosuccinate synthase [Sedimentisphaerales bacterium]
MAKKQQKVVLAYSGGLDTSVILPWLKETYGYDVIAFAAELGQGDELAGIKKKALASGATKCIVKDLRREFVEDYLWPMLKSGAIYENGYLLGTSIARPLIAKHQVDVAHAEKATAVAHGATGKGNDQVRFELTFMALDPTLEIVAPWKDPNFKLTSREAAVDYARKHNIPIEQSKKKIYSRDRNLWHISHEGADLEDPANEPKDELFVMSQPVSRTPDKPDYVTIGFHEGVPVRLDGRLTSGVKMIETLNEIGGRHAIGQVDVVENRLVGMKSRGVYETPGGTILMTAHAALESLTMERETMHYKQQVALKYAELVYYGQWFSPLREALDAFINVTQRSVVGDVRVKLFKGRCTPAGMKSPHSLYQADLASFKMGAEYDPTDAKGFIRLFGLPMRVAGAVGRREQKGGR